MSLLLAVDSATPTCSAAVLRGGEVLADGTAGPGRDHAEILLPLVDRVLREAGVALREIEAFAVAIGPGSFTSLRVGLATVKGLAFGTAQPVAAVSSLAALAWSAGASEAPLVPLLDARRGEIYAAIYERKPDDLARLLPDAVYTPDELAPHLAQRCVLVGDADLFGEALRSAAPSGCEITVISADSLSATARAVGVLGLRALARGEGMDPADLVPRYLRRAEAEVTRTGLRFESE